MNDNYYMLLAITVASLSDCIRRKVGAIIVKNNIVVSMGYNKPPKGAKLCSEVGCVREKLNIVSGEQGDLCRAVHAEQNAILHAAKLHKDIKGATIYVTSSPCNTCAKLLIEAGITEIVYDEKYNDALADELFKEVNINCRKTN